LRLKTVGGPPLPLAAWGLLAYRLWAGDSAAGLLMGPRALTSDGFFGRCLSAWAFGRCFCGPRPLPLLGPRPAFCLSLAAAFRGLRGATFCWASLPPSVGLRALLMDGLRLPLLLGLRADAFAVLSAAAAAEPRLAAFCWGLSGCRPLMGLGGRFMLASGRQPFALASGLPPFC